MLPENDEAGALRVAEEVHARIARLAVGSAGIDTGAVTVSIELALSDDRDADPAGQFNHADEALYAAKAGGRNRTEVARRIGKLSLVPPHSGIVARNAAG